MFRPEAMAQLARWRDVIIAGLVAVFGLWIALSPGPIMAGIGGVIAVAGVVFSLISLRRMRFQMDVNAPGVVEVTEGQISYMGPVMGGAVALSELSEVQGLMAGTQRCWRLKQDDGQVLLVPLAASGAQTLYDILVSLPNMTQANLNKALHVTGADPVVVWRRQAVQSRPAYLGTTS